MYSAQGIILKREDFRERDEKVFLYTKEFGKISVVAKGTKRIEAKLRGNLDIFNLVDITFVEGRNFFILTNIETRKRFSRIVQDRDIYGAALACVRNVAEVFGENMRDVEFFDILRAILEKLDAYGSTTNPSLYAWLLVKKLQVSILASQGYRAKDIEKPAGFPQNASLLLAALIGEERERASIHVSRGEISTLENFLTGSFAYLFNLKTTSWIPIMR